MMHELLTGRGSRIFRFLVIALCVFVAGCSGVVYDRGFKIGSDAGTWLDTGKGFRQFTSEGLNLRIQNYHLEADNGCNISIGPPFLPVFPLFFTCFGARRGFAIQFSVENSYDVLTVNFKSAKLLKSGSPIVPISRVEYHAAKDPIRYERCVEPFVLGKGTFILDLYYDDAVKPDEATFEFANTFSAGDPIVVPPLTFQSDNKVRFCLLAISHSCLLGNF